MGRHSGVILPLEDAKAMSSTPWTLRAPVCRCCCPDDGYDLDRLPGDGSVPGDLPRPGGAAMAPDALRMLARPVQRVARRTTILVPTGADPP